MWRFTDYNCPIFGRNYAETRNYEKPYCRKVLFQVLIRTRNITKQLLYLLRRKDYKFNTTSEIDLIRSLKEKACLITNELNEKKQTSTVKYTLPDGTPIPLIEERFKPTEVLFNPEDCLEGNKGCSIQEMLFSSLHSIDLKLRPLLNHKVFVSGGTASFEGFKKRIKAEFIKHATKSKSVNISSKERVLN